MDRRSLVAGMESFATAVLAALLTTGLAMGQASAEPPAPPPRDTQAPVQPPPECRKLPPGKKILKINLKPDSEIADLIAWYSLITCTPMMVSSGTPIAGKKVTVLSPTLVSIEEAGGLFFAALDSVGLAVEQDGKFLLVIDAARARKSARFRDTRPAKR